MPNCYNHLLNFRFSPPTKAPLMKRLKLLAALLLMASSTSAHAQTTEWLGNFGQNWTEPLNWDNGIARPGNTATFGDGTTDVLLQGNQTADDLNFSSADSYTFDTGSVGFNTLTLQTGEISSTLGSEQTLDNNVELGAASTWSLAGNLTLAGALSGAFDLVKQGDGELALTGDNSGYTQNISVDAGFLVLNGPDAASHSTTITLSALTSLGVASAEQIISHQQHEQQTSVTIACHIDYCQAISHLND